MSLFIISDSRADSKAAVIEGVRVSYSLTAALIIAERSALIPIGNHNYSVSSVKTCLVTMQKILHLNIQN